MVWLEHTVDDVEIEFPDSTWLVVEILQTRLMDRFGEEKGILRCKKVGADEEEAIIKVYMQIPDRLGLSPDELAKQATSSVSILVKTELKFLRHLTEKGCTSTPRYISYVQYQQSDEMILPGGYITFILMEKVPGEMIHDFWDYDRAKRDRIREAFKLSWIEITNAGVEHSDPGLRNLHWDESTGKCYILDFEDAEFLDKPVPWSSIEYRLWKLAKKEEPGVVIY